MLYVWSEYFLTTMEPLICRIYVYRTIHKVFISFQMSRRVFFGLSALTINMQRKCLSFKLFKQYIDCFTSMCELITMAGSGCKKYCGVEK